MSGPMSTTGNERVNVVELLAIIPTPQNYVMCMYVTA